MKDISTMRHSRVRTGTGSMGIRYRVLIVEDDPMVLQSIATYLQHFDKYEVYQAANAIEGLAMIEQMEQCDCVLADVNMPGMNGICFISQVKKKDPSIVAVIITGQPSMDITVESMRAGASDFLTKPFKFDQLQISMERMEMERRILRENRTLAEKVEAKKEIEEVKRKLQKKVKEQAALFAISEALSRIRNTQDMYREVVSLATVLTDTRRSRLWVVNHEQECLLLMGARGMTSDTAEAVDLKRRELSCVQVAMDGIPLLLSGRNGSQRTDSCRHEETAASGGEVLVPFKIRKEIFGVLSVSHPRNGKRLCEEDLFLLHLLAERASLSVENLLLYDSVSFNLNSTLRALVRSLEAKDPYTKLHSQRVTEVAVELAVLLGSSQDELDSLRFAGHLHDIGKIGIRDQILMKPGRLTRDEFDIIKTHPVIGEEIVGHLGLLPCEKAIIRHHHERWDGNGYPDGLRGRCIPRLSRILAVADTYDAITSRRPYRKAGTSEEALAEIRRNAGQQFDPDVVQVLEIYLSDYHGSRGHGIVSGRN